MENTNETSSKVASSTPKKALVKKKTVPAKKKAAPAKPKVKVVKKITAEPQSVQKKSKKEILREQIAATLETTFAGLKEALGEKKFHSHIKKASKVLAAGAIKKTKAGAKEKKH